MFIKIDAENGLVRGMNVDKGNGIGDDHRIITGDNLLARDIKRDILSRYLGGNSIHVRNDQIQTRRQRDMILPKAHNNILITLRNNLDPAGNGHHHQNQKSNNDNKTYVHVLFLLSKGWQCYRTFSTLRIRSWVRPFCSGERIAVTRTRLPVSIGSSAKYIQDSSSSTGTEKTTRPISPGTMARVAAIPVCDQWPPAHQPAGP